jgi:hypothetical protein
MSQSQASGILPDMPTAWCSRTTCWKTWPPTLTRLLLTSCQFRRFVKEYSQLAAPLTSVTSTKEAFHRGDTQQHAFQALKRALCDAPVLVLPDQALPYHVCTDASGQAVGGVLMQDTGTGCTPACAYYSHKLSPAECNHAAHDREMLAVVMCIRDWRCYLDGTHFTVHTDHRPLTHLLGELKLNSRQVRWMEELPSLTLTFCTCRALKMWLMASHDR